MILINKRKSYHLAVMHKSIRFGLSLNEGGRWAVFGFHVFAGRGGAGTWASLYLYLFGWRFYRHF